MCCCKVFYLFLIIQPFLVFAELLNMFEEYELLKSIKVSEYLEYNPLNIFLNIHFKALEYQKSLEKKELKSDILGKEYFAFISKNKISRPIRTKLFNIAEDVFKDTLTGLWAGNFNSLNVTNITMATYRLVMDFITFIDIEKTGDQKTPGTYFEKIMGILVTKKMQVAPKTSIKILNFDEADIDLPTDYIFDVGKNKPKFHVPIKTSTRERVIQVWAHQRVLDGVYGMGRIIGMMVCLSESKLDRSNHKVTEICLPDQWKLYQMFIANMKYAFYLDIPDRYKSLNNEFPKIRVKEFGEFFSEDLES